MSGVGEPVLTARHLNRIMLARQSLLTRSTATVSEVLQQVGGLQAQYAPSMYIGLWSRINGFTRPDLDHALERREVVQATLQRVTIHLVAAADYWPIAHATRTARRKQWLRTQRDRSQAETRVTKAAQQLRAHLTQSGPITRTDLATLIGEDLLSGVGLWLDLVRVPPSGTWEQRRAHTFGLAELWLAPPNHTADQALEHLVYSYLNAFGPAPAKDVADWAGLPVRQVSAALHDLEMRRFRDEQGRALFDVPDGLLPDPDVPAPVRFLPTYDATLLSHARRADILPQPYRALVFSTKKPQSVPTFTVDGAVAGTWRHADGTIQITPFAALTDAVAEQVDAEARKLVPLHAPTLHL